MGILGDISKRTVAGAVAGGALGAMSGDTNNEMLARGALGAVVGAGVGRYGGQFLGDVVADSRGYSQEARNAMQLTQSTEDLISDDIGKLFNSFDEAATGMTPAQRGRQIYDSMTPTEQKDFRQQQGLFNFYVRRNKAMATLASNRPHVINPIPGSPAAAATTAPAAASTAANKASINVLDPVDDPQLNLF